MPGIIIDDTFFDVSSFGEDYNEEFFETDGLKRLNDFIRKNRSSLNKLEADVVLDSPVARPSRLFVLV